MKILVTGGRDYTDALHVVSVLMDYDSEEVLLIHGDAKGADTLARKAAEKFGWEVEAFPAAWKVDGKAAGFIRNQAMVNQKPDLLIAFPGGKGTADCVMRAEKAGIPIRDER